MGEDPELGDDLTNERATLTEFHRAITKNNGNITHWFYGHFHQDHYQDIGGTAFKLLNINELYELKLFDGYEDELNEKYGEG
jgi:hypothetical protein